MADISDCAATVHMVGSMSAEACAAKATIIAAELQGRAAVVAAKIQARSATNAGWMTFFAGIFALIAGVLAYRATILEHHNRALAYRRYFRTSLERLSIAIDLFIDNLETKSDKMPVTINAISLRKLLGEHINLFNHSNWEQNALLPEKTRAMIDGDSSWIMLLVRYIDSYSKKEQVAVGGELPDGSYAINEFLHLRIANTQRLANFLKIIRRFKINTDVQARSLGVISKKSSGSFLAARMYVSGITSSFMRKLRRKITRIISR